jgi:hypothetical protein
MMNTNLPIDQLLPWLLGVLHSPLIFADAIRANIMLEYLKLSQLAGSGGVITVGAVIPLLKWAALALLLAAIVIFLVGETIWRFLLAGLWAKRFSRVLSDLLFVSLALVFYYIILAYVIYAFFDLILPLHSVPPAK